MNENKLEEKEKSIHAQREEEIINFWKEKNIFEKTLEKNKDTNREYVFFEGPPTANGRPGIHHLIARAFKDAIPRYKTMQGYYVRRKGGWDTHGLPVELQVEKELGLKSKKEIEIYGIGKFNSKCKESVWKYVNEWEQFTNRMAYWVDLKHPYITYKPYYIESVWNIVKEVEDKGLLYKDYKVVPWCPRCGTALSSHELAQGYDTVKDLSLFVKFKIKSEDNSSKRYILAWTTTPWTLPGNVALAVHEDIDYVELKLKENDENIILAKERLSVLKEKEYSIVNNFKGKDLIGLKYEPLYPFLDKNISKEEKNKLKNAYTVYPAQFVTTVDGTGIVHTAVMYGQDDFELGNKFDLPKYHLVNDDGTFKKEAEFFAGAFVKDQNTEIAIIKDLASRNLLFAKEKYEHTYPFCWRCHTALIYFARDSWYIEMSSLRNKLVKENKNINWEPEHIREGRFGEWLSEIKDWAISRERYWGTPLPIWLCEKCGEKKVVGDVKTISKKAKNNFFVMRHGQAENNIKAIYDSELSSASHLTEKGKEQVKDSLKEIKKMKIDLIFSSPLLRTKETAEIVKEGLMFGTEQLILDERLRECMYGVYDGKPDNLIAKNIDKVDRYVWGPEGGENYTEIKRRTGDFLYDIESKYEGKNILIVTHETPALLLTAGARGWDKEETKSIRQSGDFLNNAEIKEVGLNIIPHNEDYELDLHRPFIDEITLSCKCGAKMNRVKEVMDVWFDSGAMPFAQDHYPFENSKYIDKKGYPADFISEAIDQTRGWFYTLHAIGCLLGKGKAYRNVICLGHILDDKGRKMSKSLGNVVNPWEMMDKYGADALRFWMYSINQPGDSKNFEEKTVDEIIKKVFNPTLNVLAFYNLYANDHVSTDTDSNHILDIWIMSRMQQLLETVTVKMDEYKFFESSRAIRDFVTDLSQWYLRRSRDRFKGNDENDKKQALNTTRYILQTLAKIMAPFTPCFAEHLYLVLRGPKESVHLEDWPSLNKKSLDKEVIEKMQIVRDLASLGLEARMKAGINVRQPLKSLRINIERLKIKNVDYLKNQYIDILKEEINVKQIDNDLTLDKIVSLDTNITEELKEEGNLRELIRVIQDLRKEKGLTVYDRVTLKVETDEKGKELIEKYKKDIERITILKGISFESLDGEERKIDNITFKLIFV